MLPVPGRMLTEPGLIAYTLMEPRGPCTWGLPLPPTSQLPNNLPRS